MATDLLLAFRGRRGEAPPLAELASSLGGRAGVGAARAFTVNVLLGERPPAGSPELAVDEIEGPIEQVTGDLGRAMAAGAISLPDWFDRFASLEAVAAGGIVPEPASHTPIS